MSSPLIENINLKAVTPSDHIEQCGFPALLGPITPKISPHGLQAHLTQRREPQSVL
jgi:hypothetical protein